MVFLKKASVLKFERALPSAKATVSISARRSRTGKLKPQTQQETQHTSLKKKKQNGMLEALPLIRENSILWRWVIYYSPVRQTPKGQKLINYWLWGVLELSSTKASVR
jgi:hypothetical protein